jgi:hypothetical protein
MLAAMSLGFGLLAQLFAGRGTTRCMWLIGASTFFVVGLLISEVWFGWATEADLQPNIDGLLRERGATRDIPSIAIVVLTRHMVKRRSSMPTGPAPKARPCGSR